MNNLIVEKLEENLYPPWISKYCMIFEAELLKIFGTIDLQGFQLRYIHNFASLIFTRHDLLTCLPAFVKGKITEAVKIKIRIKRYNFSTDLQ